VNIWREISQGGAGIVAPDTVDGTQQLLSRWLALGSGERAEMGARAAALFARRFTVDAMATGVIGAIQGATA
jgi:glycosyltransferase involved in cell wall biosynthesis